MKADFNENAVRQLNSIIAIDKIEASSASGYLPDYDQFYGDVIRYSRGDINPKHDSLDYFKQGLIIDADISQTYRKICSRASVELKKRGFLQIDYLEGEPYLRIYSDNSLITNNLMPLIKGYKLEHIAKLMGFRHLKTFTLSSNVTIHNGHPETLKSALFMKV